jgi:hypothetical protein
MGRVCKLHCGLKNRDEPHPRPLPQEGGEKMEDGKWRMEDRRWRKADGENEELCVKKY